MKYYLETNSLRRIIPKLENETLAKNSYTSILAIMELISGINDNDSYQTRKIILKRILQSKLPICLNLSETLIYKSFGFNIDDIKIVSGIRSVIPKLIDSNSYKNFHSLIIESESNQYYKFLLQYDKNGSSYFKESFVDNIDKVRKETGFKKMINAFNDRWNSKNEFEVNDLYNFLVENIANGIYEIRDKILPNDERTLKQIKESYDHSIDLFIILASYYSDNHVSFGNLPGKNDYFDLSHLVYLENDRKIIVTDDKLFHKIMKGSLSDYTITTDFYIKNCI